MATSSNATFSFTLPISCQICLAKVKEPVCCENNHVYCRACIDIWTSKSQHCPTCRTPINSEKPYRQLLGGQDSGIEGTSTFSQPMIRKARVKSLFNSYEEEIQRLNDCIASLQEENRQLNSSKANDRVSPRVPPADTEDKQSVEILTSKLSEATQLYHKVCADVSRCEQEKGELEKANISLSRENDSLRYDLCQRTPSKVGRFTVATLETQIEKQKKEIISLEKALEASDKYIDSLRGQLKSAPLQSNTSQPNSDASSSTTQSMSRSLFPTQLTAAVTATVAPVCPPTAHLASGQLPAVVEDSSLTCSTQWKGSPVSQLLVSGLSSSSAATGSDITSCTSDLDSYNLVSPCKRKRTDSSNWRDVNAKTLHNLSHLGCLATDKSTLGASSSYSTDGVDTESMFDGVQATDISMTTEYTDCLRILHQAEKKVKEKETQQTLPS